MSSPHGRALGCAVPVSRPGARPDAAEATMAEPDAGTGAVLGAGTGGGARAYAAAGELLRALSAPVRVAIVTLLSTGPRCVHELVDELGVAQPLVSQHLRVLRAAGVVAGERRGREVAYHLTDDRVGHLVADAVAHVQE